MFYSMWHGSAFNAAKEVTVEEYGPDGANRLTDADYLKDENGNYVLDEEANRIISLSVNNSPCPLPNKFIEGYGAYFIFDKLPDGSVRWPRVREYVNIIGNGIKNDMSWDEILTQLGEYYLPDLSLFDGKNSKEETEE